MIGLFMHKEAEASVALDKDENMQTMAEGLTDNPKLYGIIITIKNKVTDEVLWTGPLAHITRARERGLIK